MFLARFNYEIVNGKAQKVKYNPFEVYENVDTATDEQLLNFLLDMYQGVLTSPDHILSTATPLDVATGPISEFAKETIKQYQGGEEDGIADNFDGFHLNPVYQNRNKKLNSGSDEGIGPMALNSVFLFLTQVSKLKMYRTPILELLGLNELGETFDRYGEEILDSTSGLINAFVDAAKDNYIGNANVNGYTYDVTAMLIALGMGNDTFAFLTLPIIKQVSKNWLTYKNGLIGISDKQKTGNYYKDSVIEQYAQSLKTLTGDAQSVIPTETKRLMSLDTLLKNLKPDYNNPQWVADLLEYLNIFMQIYDLAKDYHDAISNALIDTKKYGVNVNQLLAFILGVEMFNSGYNTAFENPGDLFNNTFLGSKYLLGVKGLFKVFNSMLPEFSEVYVKTAEDISRRFGMYGRGSKKLLKVLGPKIKTVLYTPFFNQYIVERYGTSKTLTSLTFGDNSVPGRYEYIKRKAMLRNEGIDLFNAVKYNKIGDVKIPQFMLVTQQFKENPDIKNNVQLALTELFESSDPEIRQWANDFAVYMFYVSGGTDSNAGGVVRTTVYDIIPPQYLSNLVAGGMTFNQYVQEKVMSRKGSMTDSEIDQVLSLLAISDDTYIPTISSKGNRYTYSKVLGANVITIKKGSYSLFNQQTNTYSPFIKVATDSGYDLYKLGEQLPVEYKGKTYFNPVYYRVNKLGYRSKARFAYSLRADGYITEDGKIKSMLWNDNEFEAINYQLLNEKLRKSYMGYFKLTEEPKYGYEIYSRNGVNYSGEYVPGEKFDGKQVRALIDKTDAIYLLIDDSFQKYVNFKNYVFFKNKEFHVISGDTDNIPTSNGNSITILGSDVDLIKRVANANSGKTVYADPKIINGTTLSEIENINSLEELGEKIKNECKKQ